MSGNPGQPGSFPTRQLRRLRRNATLREMLAEVRLSVQDFIAPLFVLTGRGQQREISTLPGQFQFSPDTALETVQRWSDKGIPAVLLFGLPEHKDEFGSGAWDPHGPVQELTRQIKRHLPEVVVITDTCLCEYTDHGHCGALRETDDGRVEVDNMDSLALLGKVAVSQAEAGADLVAPSAMMDGQVAAIRKALDEAELSRTGILSYAVKYASAMYGPFRDAAGSAPGFGDRRGYQMDPRQRRQAFLEAGLDEAEGADLLMVKPAATYLDILAEVRRRTDLPVAGYHVSGEYAMLKAAAAGGAFDERSAVLEVTTAIRRAGADLVMTYYAEQLADWLAKG
jgi:porphobilinogen synthase